MHAAWVDGSGADGLKDGYTEEGDTVSYNFTVGTCCSKVSVNCMTFPEPRKIAWILALRKFLAQRRNPLVCSIPEAPCRGRTQLFVADGFVCMTVHSRTQEVVTYLSLIHI